MLRKFYRFAKNYNMKNLLSILALATIFVFTSCGKDDPDPIIPQEVITTLIYTLNSGSDTYEFRFSDPDGDGEMSPTLTAENLPANTTFTGTIQLLNETIDPVEDVTLEVSELDLEHQFFYSTTVNGTVITYNDQDSDGNPVGILTGVTTGDAGNGELSIVLRHEPAKDAEGVSGGDITNAGGESDIEVTFDLNVQ